MEPSSVPDGRWSQLSGFIADAMGLHFPRERWTDLQRGLTGAADEFGFDDIAACADWLLSAPLTKEQLQVLAGHLTIGETYFFRDKQTFDVLANSVLPELIRSQRGREQRLRLWSAGCCSGEEAYSLAILLRQVLPDLTDWHVTILATDINARFLRKAVAGSYGEWSFRDAPAGLKERYFNRSADGRYVVMPEIKEMVAFAHLNLAEDVYPSLATDTNAMDLIFCRNVLMYFAPEQARKVIGNIHRSLVDGGRLFVSPSEASPALFPRFAALTFPGVILYQKNGANARGGQRSMPAPIGHAELFTPTRAQPLAPEQPPTTRQMRPVPIETSPTHAAAASLYKQGRYAEASDALLALCLAHNPEPPAFSLLARALANQGKLSDALTWCDRWIAADKLDSAGHYLRAVILLEYGDPEQARRSLQRAIYFHPEFILAHFALGNLARQRGNPSEADKHFGNALRLLAGHPTDALLLESDGLTAGRLIETITTLTSVEQAL